MKSFQYNEIVKSFFCTDRNRLMLIIMQLKVYQGNEYKRAIF